LRDGTGTVRHSRRGKEGGGGMRTGKTLPHDDPGIPPPRPFGDPVETAAYTNGFVCLCRSFGARGHTSCALPRVRHRLARCLIVNEPDRRNEGSRKCGPCNDDTRCKGHRPHRVANPSCLSHVRPYASRVVGRSGHTGLQQNPCHREGGLNGAFLRCFAWGGAVGICSTAANCHTRYLGPLLAAVGGGRLMGWVATQQ
jgi:hypothetical protein